MSSENARGVIEGMATAAALIPGAAGPIVSGLLRGLAAILHRRSPEEALAKLRELAEEDIPHIDAAKIAEDAIERA